MNARGFLLLEVMLAVTLSVLAGVAGFALLTRLSDRVTRSQDTLVASDIACSALAMIESGIATAENLHGSVQTDVIALEAAGSGTLVRDPSFTLEIDTAPTQWTGLVQVDVRVLRVEDEAEVYAVSQLIRSEGGLR